MGAILSPSTRISGAAGNPGIPFIDSPTGGFYETKQSGLGFAFSGNSFWDFNSSRWNVGNAPVKTPSLTAATGSPFATSQNPYAVCVSPDGRHVYFSYPVVGNARIGIYARNNITGALTFIGQSALSIDSLREIVISPDGAHVYAVNASAPGGLSISAFSRNLSTGLLTVINNYIGGGVGTNFLCISPNGQYLISTNGALGVVTIYSRNAATGVLTITYNANPASVNSPNQITFSPDGSHVYLTDSGLNVVSAYSFNYTTGLLTFINSYAVGGAPYICAISPDGLNVVSGGLTANTIYNFTRNPTTGALSAPVTQVANGGSPGSVGYSAQFSPDGQYLAFADTNSSNVRFYTRNLTTGALAFSGNFGMISFAYELAFSPDNLSLIVPMAGGAGSLAYVYQLTPAYPLVQMTFDQTGGAGGTFNVNGNLQLLGSPAQSQDTTDVRYVPKTARTAAIPATDTGSYVESTVLVGAAVALTTAVNANVTSISLPPGTWDVSGVVHYRAGATTNINDATQGISSTSAVFDPVGSYTMDYLMIVPGAGPDAAYMAPVEQYYNAGPANLVVYLVAMAHFTVSTLAAYGNLRARRI